MADEANATTEAAAGNAAAASAGAGSCAGAGAAALVVAGTTVETSFVMTGCALRLAANADMPRATSLHPVSLHNATRPPMTLTVRPSRSTAVYSVPRMPIRPTGVSRR